ncbi:WD40-repeat-containing domain protein [Clohesyomyces aquaticus]|uniref:WD40-repeat-containing domain protein n=1 Tax=Clohesyomyces aquaticus TaxID=1231657 RepID=A0A1Y1XVS4_9PLEO|nr:WD40-repeat-containing domain protein [Clohesyomyces aquaticus]
MTADSLSSNVVNYLVWRYLQEAGFGYAAAHLSKQWLPKPEELPFAKNVPRLALVHILQDGLYLDQIQSETTDSPRRFDFGRDHGRPFSARNGATLTLDEGTPAHILAMAETTNGAVQEPNAPRKGPGGKKKRKANGIDMRMGPQINGDAMDVDQNGNNHASNSVRADSEAVGSDAESPSVDQIPISTLTLGHDAETQTEKPTDLAPNTRMASIKDKDKGVLITEWAETPSGPLFFTVGNSLLRAHMVPRPPNSQVLTGDLTVQPREFSSTAFCLASHDKVFLAATERLVNEGGEVMETEKLYKVTPGTDDSANYEWHLVSSTAGIVLAIAWNESAELLLTLSTDGKEGSIKIWKDDDSSLEQIPKWTAFAESNLLDACWINDSIFVVCGHEIFHVYEIADNDLRLKQSYETNVKWEKVIYDSTSGIIASRSMLQEHGFLGIVHPSDLGNLQTHQYPDQDLIDFAFRPRANTASSVPSSPVLLATCSADGFTRIWDANQPFTCLRKLSYQENMPKENLAFSPDGKYLAVAGPYDLMVWDPEKTAVPVATWQATDLSKEEWEPGSNDQFTLGWDPDGSRLSITLGNQIAIVPFPR